MALSKYYVYSEGIRQMVERIFNRTCMEREEVETLLSNYRMIEDKYLQAVIMTEDGETIFDDMGEATKKFGENVRQVIMEVDRRIDHYLQLLLDGRLTWKKFKDEMWCEYFSEEQIAMKYMMVVVLKRRKWWMMLLEGNIIEHGEKVKESYEGAHDNFIKTLRDDCATHGEKLKAAEVEQIFSEQYGRILGSFADIRARINKNNEQPSNAVVFQQLNIANNTNQVLVPGGGRVGGAKLVSPETMLRRVLDKRDMKKSMKALPPGSTVGGNSGGSIYKEAIDSEVSKISEVLDERKKVKVNMELELLEAKGVGKLVADSGADINDREIIIEGEIGKR